MGRSWTAFVLVLVASCLGGSSGDVDETTADRPRMCDGNFFCTPPRDCDPLSEPGSQGCGAGQKCTWVVVQQEPERLGKVDCVADGTVPLGGACEPAPVGAGDECVAGTICLDGRCRDICGFDGSEGAACSEGGACVQYDGAFANGDDDPVAGACNPSCDPLTQLQDDGAPCPAGDGCYAMVTATDTIATCARAGTVAVGEVITGGAFANTCVPGAQPRGRDPAGMVRECGGLCRPTDVTSAGPANEGGLAPDDCQGRWGAPAPDDATAGESCRYFHMRELQDGLSPFSNTLGWCFSHARYAAARCIDLPPGMAAVDNGCTAQLMPAAAAAQQVAGGLVAPVAQAPAKLDRLRR